MGFVAGRWLRVRKEALAPLLIYLIMPLVIFRGVTAVQMDAARLLLPVVVYALCCVICLVALRIGRVVFSGAAPHILALGAGNSNSGYFGLPVAVALLGEQAFAQAVMISFGFIMFENTLGFYVVALGRHGRREALKKVLALPSAYAFFIGLGLRALGATLPDGLDAAFVAVRGAYTVLGMMLVGLALGDLKVLRLDRRFIGFALLAKHLVWPLVIVALLALDAAGPRLFDDLARRGLLIAALLPMAANTVAFAALFHAEPEKTSLAVVLSTALAVIMLPALAPWL